MSKRDRPTAYRRIQSRTSPYSNHIVSNFYMVCPKKYSNWPPPNKDTLDIIVMSMLNQWLKERLWVDCKQNLLSTIVIQNEILFYLETKHWRNNIFISNGIIKEIKTIHHFIQLLMVYHRWFKYINIGSVHWLCTVFSVDRCFFQAT